MLTAFDLIPASGLALSILAEAGTPLSPNEIAGRPIISRGRRDQLAGFAGKAKLHKQPASGENAVGASVLTGT